VGKSTLSRQKEIIDAAIEIIVTKGLQELSIRNIAKIVGIKESSIYSHFESKSEIIEKMLNLFQEDAELMWKEIYQTASNSIEELEGFFKKTCYGSINNQSSSYVLWFCSHQFKKEHFDQVKYIFEIHRNNLFKAIKEGQTQGLIKDEFNFEYISSLISGQAYIFLFRNLCALQYGEKDVDKIWEMLEILIKKGKS
jgi:AcrR family transcriptional regulator